MRKRDVPRFLIAPSGFGKTSLAAEYAESIFSFRDVFWINAQSPCFLRDIDKGVFARSLLAHSHVPSLAVIEDVPDLNGERCEAVAGDIDALLERGWEVVVSMRPECESLVDREPDGIRIRADDFLLTDQEFERLADEGIAKGGNFRSLAPAERVAGIVIGGREGTFELLNVLANDRVASDVMLGLFVMIVLGEGSFDDASMFTGSLKSDTRTKLMRDYLFVGVDGHSETFRTYPFPIEDVVEAFSRPLFRIASSSMFQTPNLLTARLADVLVARKQYDRACKLVNGCADAESRIAWLDSRSKELASAGCLLSAHALFKSKAIRLGAQTADLFCQEARRLAALGDTVKALELADQVIDCVAAVDSVHASAALIVARYAQNSSRERAMKVLRGLVRISANTPPAICMSTLCEALKNDNHRWKAPVIGELWLTEGIANAELIVEACCAYGRVGVTETTLLLWTLETFKLAGHNGVHSIDGKVGSEVLIAVGEYLRRCADDHHIGLWETELLSEWDVLKAAGSPDALYPPLEGVRASARSVQARVIAQRSTYERVRREDRGAPQAQTIATQPERWEVSPPRPESVPVLHIKLLGGLEVSLGGQLIDQKKLHRQKVKTLLALLTLNQGKELLRPRLATLLWPDSTAETAQRNFYAIWSMLRKALTNSEGDCPYLHRLQYGCKLDLHVVTSDIAEFDTLCNHLLFDQPDIEVWSGVYMRLNDLYRGDLLPSEGRNDFINQARGEYRARLVDALVAASTRLFEHGELQASMWFAHAGVRRDATREDAYTALMRAQIGTGQRTAALDTYFRCKRFLSDELGIDPSPQAVTLYQTIIAAEPNLSSFQPKISLID